MALSYNDYKEKTDAIFAKYTKEGFVDYTLCRKFAGEMIRLLEKAADDLLKQGKVKDLFNFANETFLRWSNTEIYDINGDARDFSIAIEKIWERVYIAPNADISHEEMYDWFEVHMDGSVIDFMEEYLYGYIALHFVEPEILEKKYAFLKEKLAQCEKIESEVVREIRIERCKGCILYTMADMKKPIEEIREFAVGLKYDPTKEAMAEIEHAYGNYEEAIAIYQELAQDDERRGVPSTQWKEKLEQLYKEFGERQFKN